MARRQGKPILLFLSASWCHWCHVMEADTLLHPEVARLIDGHYVPVRVDTDKQPDVNLRYNMGGWPSVVLLTPEGDVLAGETYLPPGPMIQMLQQFRNGAPPGTMVAADRGVKEAGEGRTDFPKRLDLREAAEEVILWTSEWIKRTFDPAFGGFMGPMKFPMPSVLDLTMALIGRAGEDPWRRILCDTLNAMRDREIHDSIDGGFFRYSVSDDWSRPHYEKMLETQAHLLVTYLSAYRLTADVLYRVTAEGILRYAQDELWVSGEGWFAGSQTADREYYQSSEEERAEQPSPAVDRTLYVEWNASMVRGLLKAALSLRKPELSTQALGLLDFITERCLTGNSVAVHYYDESGPSAAGYLGDQSSLIQALLDAYEHSAEDRYLELARGILDAAIAGFWDEAASKFRDRVNREGDPEGLRMVVYPLAENSGMAQALVRAGRLMQVEDYTKRAERLFASLMDQYKRYRLHASPYALALERWLRPERRVVRLEDSGREEAPNE